MYKRGGSDLEGKASSEDDAGPGKEDNTDEKAPDGPQVSDDEEEGEKDKDRLRNETKDQEDEDEEEDFRTWIVPNEMDVPDELKEHAEPKEMEEPMREQSKEMDEPAERMMEESIGESEESSEMGKSTESVMEEPDKMEESAEKEPRKGRTRKPLERYGDWEFNAISNAIRALKPRWLRKARLLKKKIINQAKNIQVL